MILIASAIMDFSTCKIPNFFIGIGLPIGLCYRILILNDRNYLSILCSVLLPLVLLFPFFIFRAMGAGDIKLFMVVGTFLSPELILQSIFWAAITGAFIGLIRMLINRNLVNRMEYFISYTKKTVKSLSQKNMKIEPYFQNGTEKDCKKIRLHFSLPILLGSESYQRARWRRG